MKNTYILMIVQALLALLLFFSVGTVKYVTIALFIFIDLILFVDLLMRKWSFEELLTFAAIFCSGIFMLFYIYMQSSITTVFGVALMLLFLVTAMLDVVSKPMASPIASKNTSRFEKLNLPQAPVQYDNIDTEYDLDYEPQPIRSSQSIQSSQPSQFQKSPEPVMHIRQEKKSLDIKGKLAAQSVAYELEREASQLKNAEKMIADLKLYDTETKVYDAEKELVRESKLLENAQKQVDAMNRAARTAQAEAQLHKEAAELLKAQKKMNVLNTTARKTQAETQLKKEALELLKAQKQMNSLTIAAKKSNAEAQLKKEAAELLKAQKQMNSLTIAAKKSNAEAQLRKEADEIKKAQKQIDDIKKIKELEKETKALKKAEKQVKEVQFLNQQERIVNQARGIAKAQKKIDEMNKSTKKSLDTQVSKASKTKDVVVKTKKTNDESFYFATENGNKFHEPGCLSIKKVPKNKLTLYTSKKDAMKKGLQPCNVCIPK